MGGMRQREPVERVIAAIELAERILDEVSNAEQDWRAVEHLADALARLAAALGRETEGTGSGGEKSGRGRRAGT
jgi:hypothetical protein